MAELRHGARLQPSLLDRLEVGRRHRQGTIRPDGSISPESLREILKEDLQNLLGTSNLGAVVDLEPYPEVARSTLNYGIPGLTGSVVSPGDLAALEQAISRAILDFEPRLVPRTLKVRAHIEGGTMTNSMLTFMVEGEMWGQPAPTAVRLQSTLDLLTGGVEVRDKWS